MRQEESKYTFVFVASVNIVHQLWACCDVTGGTESAKSSMCSFSVSLNGANADRLVGGWISKWSQTTFKRHFYKRIPRQDDVS